jgi:hypothetical protein
MTQVMNPTMTLLAVLALSGSPDPSPPQIVHGVRALTSATSPRPVRPALGSLTPARARAYFPAPQISSEHSQ